MFNDIARGFMDLAAAIFLFAFCAAVILLYVKIYNWLF